MNFNFDKAVVFDWGELYYIKLENEIGIEAFKLLNSNQENALLSIKDKFRANLKNDEAFSSLEESEKGNYYSQMYEIEELAIKELQRQQRYSICLSIFSFFEGRLKAVCNKIERNFNFKIKIEDLNGNDDLLRYWNYLEKVFEMEMDSLMPNFTPIKQNKNIRNIIAHHEGYANVRQKQKMEMSNGLSLKETGDLFRIQIDKSEYINYLLVKMEGFFEKMLSSIDKRYSEKVFREK